MPIVFSHHRLQLFGAAADGATCVPSGGQPLPSIQENAPGPEVAQMALTQCTFRLAGTHLTAERRTPPPSAGPHRRAPGPSARRRAPAPGAGPQRSVPATAVDPMSILGYTLQPNAPPLRDDDGRHVCTRSEPSRSTGCWYGSIRIESQTAATCRASSPPSRAGLAFAQSRCCPAAGSPACRDRPDADRWHATLPLGPGSLLGAVCRERPAQSGISGFATSPLR
jgi:hypothetical protein